MRKTLLVGVVLTVTAVLVVLVGAALDLKLEPVAFLGVGLGAVVALVPDRTPLMRLVGFAAGFVVAWVLYLVRAAMLPDSTGGQAVMFGIVMALAVVIAAVSMGRIPLWSTVLGAGGFAGAYERTFAAAIPEAATTSATVGTGLLLATAVGFLAAALVAPRDAAPAAHARRERPVRDDDTNHRLDDLMMETSK